MKKLVILLCIISLLSLSASAQANFGSPFVFPGVPSGTCASNQLAVNSANGDLYSCLNGSWRAVASFPMLATDGTVGAPSYSFASAPTWGMWKDASGIEWSFNGVNLWRWDTNGQFHFSGSVGSANAGIYIDSALGTNAGSILRGSGGGMTISNAVGDLNLNAGTSGGNIILLNSQAGKGIFLAHNATGQVTVGNIPSISPAVRTLQVGESGITTADLAGSNGTIQSSPGTGLGTPTTLLFNGPIKGVTGSTAQTQVIRFALNDTKQLTSGAATTVVSAPLATLQMTGGTIDYHIEVSDGTNQCTRDGQMSFDGENSAGVFVTAVTNPAGANDANSCTATKTLTLAWAATGANPSLIQVTPTTNIAAPTLFQIVYEVHYKGQTVPTL